MKHLILLVGSLQSGKTSTATAIMGHYLTNAGIIPNFNIRDDGKAHIVYDKKRNIGSEFDIETRDPAMVRWFAQSIWPHVKNESFATKFKNILIDFFGVNELCIYGTNEQKNSKTNIKTLDVLVLVKHLLDQKLHDKYLKRVENDPSDLLSGRELMQLFGSEVCRTIYENCNIDSAIRSLAQYDPEIGIIPDGRFANEVKYFQKIKDKSDINIIFIKLLRSEYEKTHKAEQAAPEIPDSEYHLVVDNQDMTIHEKNQIVIDYLIDEGVLLKGSINSTAS